MNKTAYRPLGSLLSLVTSRTGTRKNQAWPYVGLENIPSGGSSIVTFGSAEDSISTNSVFYAGDILFGKLRPRLRKSLRVDRSGYCSTDVLVLRPTAGVDPVFVSYVAQSDAVFSAAIRTEEGTKMPRCSWKDLRHVKVFCPKHQAAQNKIALILSSIDTVITKTEVLIGKYQQIKAGLTHDLFTRGVLPNGKLRPPRSKAPELYRETTIGWIPREWAVKDCSAVVHSITDGPFGSNLKTEHYVADPGVRVVRLQNVAEHEYDDSDRAYITDRHARYLVRNRVVGGDVLIAGLGEDRYPVGRACTYPDDLPPAVNKADCFRVRCIAEIMYNKFFMMFLNSVLARQQIRRYEQGVTRPRINTGNLKRVIVGVPDLDEQAAFIAKFEAVQAMIRVQEEKVAKLKAQKLGLMQDLLTGKVPVQVDEPESAHA